MSKTSNKNKKKSVIWSVCILGAGLVVGAFLTLENHVSQINLIKSVNESSRVIMYEGKITECDNEMEKCIRIGSGGNIEKLE